MDSTAAAGARGEMPVPLRQALRSSLRWALLAAFALATGCMPFAGDGDRTDDRPPTAEVARLLLDLQAAELDGTLPGRATALVRAEERAGGQGRRELTNARERLLLDLLLLPDPAPAPADEALAVLLGSELPAGRRERARAALSAGIDDARAATGLRVISDGPLALLGDEVSSRLRHTPEVQIAVLRDGLERLALPAAQLDCPGPLLWMTGRVAEEPAHALCGCAGDGGVCASVLESLAELHAPAGLDHWSNADVYWLDAVDALRRQVIRDAAADVRAARWQEPLLTPEAAGLLDRRLDEPLPRRLWRGDVRLNPPELPPHAGTAPADLLPRASSRRVLLTRSTGIALTLRPVVVFNPDATQAADRWQLLAERSEWALPGREVVPFAGLATPLSGLITDGHIPLLADGLGALDDSLPERFTGSPNIGVLIDGETRANTLLPIWQTLLAHGLHGAEWLALAPEDGRPRALPLRLADAVPEDAVHVQLGRWGVRVFPPREVVRALEENGDIVLASPEATVNAAAGDDEEPGPSGPPLIRWSEIGFFSTLGRAVEAAMLDAPRPVAVEVTDALAEWALIVKVSLASGWAFGVDEDHPWRQADAQWPDPRGSGEVVVVLSR